MWVRAFKKLSPLIVLKSRNIVASPGSRRLPLTLLERSRTSEDSSLRDTPRATWACR